MSDKPLNHQVLVVRVPEPRVHTNADTLVLFDILGYQVVSKKDNFKTGDLAIYIQPDSVVPQTEPFRWIWEPYITNLDDRIDENGKYASEVPAKRRRITVRKFRGEWSEGLLMPTKDFEWQEEGKEDARYPDGIDIAEGMDVSDILNITHYEPEGEVGGGSAAPKRKSRRPKTLRGWLRFFWYQMLHLTHIKRQQGSYGIEVAFDAPQYDVDSLKASRTGFAPGETVTVTEKLHGSNARFVFLDGVFYIGSHFQWKSPDAPCIFTRVAKQHPCIEEWCRANEGRILYGEVIGDQKGAHYGLDKSKGELGFRAFDIREPNGTWTKPWNEVSEACGECELPWLNVNTIVPKLYTGPADNELFKSLTDGKSAIDDKTQREGIVISEEAPAALGHRRPRQFKRVSNVFLEKDSKQ